MEILLYVRKSNEEGKVISQDKYDDNFGGSASKPLKVFETLSMISTDYQSICHVNCNLDSCLPT